MLPRSTLFLTSLVVLLNLIESARWISEEEFLYDDNSTVTIFNVRTQEKTRKSELNTKHAISGDLRYTAEFIVKPEAYRHPDNVLFSIIIHNISNNFTYPVGLSSTADELQAFKWSHGSAYAFQLSNGNVYYVSSPGESPVKITNNDDSINYELMHRSGKFNAEDELVDAFSQSDKYLVLGATDPSIAVNNYKKVILTTYTQGDAYDYNYEMDMIKPGDYWPPAQSIAIWSISEKRLITIDVQSRANPLFHNLMFATWAVLHGKEVVVVALRNRYSNHSAVHVCSYESESCSLVYEFKYKPGQWIEHKNYFKIVHSNSSIFFILPEDRGDNAWQHIVKVDISVDFKFEGISFLPSGEYDVQRIVAYRPVEDIVIYVAKAPNPWNMHIYATPAGNGSVLAEDRCLTCVSKQCSYQPNAIVSKGHDLHIALECGGPIARYPAVISFNATLHSSELYNITALSQEDRRLWKTEYFALSSGYEAIVRIFEGNSSLSSVPVTLHVYGGPNSNYATDKFDTSEDDGSAIVKIDVRGSGGRGWKYRSAIYRRLVTVEVDDTIEAMRLVLDKYPRLDRSRVGVHGWSYGGTMTAALVEKAPPGFFKCAMVGAPVTNFIYYHAEYSERYMGNAPASEYTDLNRNVTAFRDTKLLLVHGLRDENVLFQNSAMLIASLQKENIQFELMVYPNKDHKFPLVDKHFKQLFKSFFSTCYA